MYKVGDKVKYTVKGHEKSGVVHGVSRQADGKKEKVVAYLFDETPQPKKKGDYVDPVIVSIDVADVSEA